MLIHTETPLRHFQFWSGGADNANCLSYEQLDELEKAVGYAYEDPENAAGKDNPLWFSEIDRSKASAVKHTPRTNRETLLDFLERKNYDAAFEGSEAYMKLINKLRAAAGDTANGKTA